MTEYVINGAKFHTVEGFYNYIENQFTLDVDWKIGRNLNAFNDVLRGGFGRHDCDERISIKWVNFFNSKERLENTFLDAVVEIINTHESVVKFDVVEH